MIVIIEVTRSMFKQDKVVASIDSLSFRAGSMVCANESFTNSLYHGTARLPANQRAKLRLKLFQDGEPTLKKKIDNAN